MLLNMIKKDVIFHFMTSVHSALFTSKSRGDFIIK